MAKSILLLKVHALEGLTPNEYRLYGRSKIRPLKYGLFGRIKTLYAMFSR